jgi:hypothetical protein
MTPGFDYDYFDAAQALHWYCANYHEGQGSELYGLLSALKYNPGRLENGPDSDGPSGMLYEMLESGEADARVMFDWIKQEILKRE